MRLLRIRCMTFVLLVALALSACQSEPALTGKDMREREYLKSFINEFGSETGSDKWLDVSRTTLTVISEHTNPVKVYYTGAAGERILIGDLSIPAGREEVPFILPTGISRLIVESSGNEYTVAIGYELNLDKAIPNNLSRATPGPNDFRPTAASRRIRFKPENVMNVYRAKFPENENNLNVPNKDDEVNFWGKFYFTGNWMLYPVFWKWTRTDQTYSNITYGADMTIQWSDNNILDHTYVRDGLNSGWNLLTFYSDIPDAEMEGYKDVFLLPANYQHGYFTEGQTISSKDFSLWANSNGVCMKTGDWTPNLLFTPTKENKQLITSDASGYKNWSNRFWNVPIAQLHQAYQNIVIYQPKNQSVKYTVPDRNCVYSGGNPANATTITDWEEKTIDNPIFIGINRPAMEHKSNGTYLGETGFAPDFNDFVFLLVPDDDNASCAFYNLGATAATTSTFTLAAEDLGGSFDWDFNDAVFQVSYVTKNASSIMKDYYEDIMGKPFYDYEGVAPSPDTDGDSYMFEITVTPLAAGGTMPIYVAYHGKVLKSYEQLLSRFTPSTTYNEIINAMSEIEMEWEDGVHIIGEELHSWLGEPNTGKVVNVTSAKADHQAAYKVVFYAYDNPADKDAIAGHLHHFSVIVDADKTLDIKRPTYLRGDANDSYQVNKYVRETGLHAFTPNGMAYEIGGLSDKKEDTAPQMIRIGDCWAREMINIKQAFNGGNEGNEKSLVELWLNSGGDSPWYKPIDKYVTRP